MSDLKTTIWPAGTRLLHVLGADGPHDEVMIVGTADALRALRDAISRALEVGEGAAKGTLTRDGEGFWPFVVRATEAQMEQVPLHYTGEPFNGRGEIPDWLDEATCRAAQEAINGRQF